MKLFVALGPGDIVGAAKYRLTGKPLPSTSKAYSEQIFTYCNANTIETLAISYNSRQDKILDGLVSIENRPKPLQGGRGLLYHLVALYYASYLAYRAKRFGADLAVIDSGTTHYFLLTIFRLMGIAVVINMHNVFWPVGFLPTKGLSRTFRVLNAWFFQNLASGAIGVSPECERQFISESFGRLPFFQYRCQFEQGGFRQAKPYKSGTFHIVYVGRAEENKGYLDISKIALVLRVKSSTKIVFHMCGDGPAVPVLRRAIREQSLVDMIIIHGHLQRSDLLNLYAKSHAVIVPTRSTFAEGMPQVCAEAVLSGLPVITSPVSNALDVIGPAIVRAETDNIESYVDAILRLTTESGLIERLTEECSQLSRQFLTPSQSCAAAVDRILHTLYPK